MLQLEIELRFIYFLITLHRNITLSVVAKSKPIEHFEYHIEIYPVYKHLYFNYSPYHMKFIWIQFYLNIVTSLGLQNNEYILIS